MKPKIELNPDDIAYIIIDKNRCDFVSSQANKGDQWFNINELCAYHPEKPAKSTVYAWVAAREIPFHKKGKKLLFLKSEIDNWIKGNYNNNKIKSL